MPGWRVCSGIPEYQTVALCNNNAVYVPTASSTLLTEVSEPTKRQERDTGISHTEQIATKLP